MRVRPIVTALISALLVLGALPGPAGASHAYHPYSATPLVDSIDVVVRDRELIAIDARRGGGVVRARLSVGEEVLWVDARGKVAIVVTDPRILGITTRSARWREVRLRVHESLPLAVVVGERVGLVLTSERAIGISGVNGRFVETEIGTHEKPVDALVGENVAVLITDRRVLGLSGFVPGFFEERVGIHEDLEFASTLANFATVGTQRRVLIFRAPVGAWEAERVSLR